MDSEITAMTGCDELVKTESDFHAMKAVVSTNKTGSVSSASVRIDDFRLLSKSLFLDTIIVAFVNAHESYRILYYYCR